MKITKEIKEKVKSILKDLPKERSFDDDEYFCTYELMIYTYDEDGKTDFHDFAHFKGIGQLNKAIQSNIEYYKDTLYCIDFKYSYEEGEFDQFTIYTHTK
jgi:hypothetical protein